MHKTRSRRVGALIVGLTLLAASCGDDAEDTDAGAADTTEAAAAETTAAPAPETTAAAAEEETTTSAEAGASTEGALAGMKGTTPLVELSDDFTTRMDDAWVAAGNDALTDFNYAAETYDAVVIIALAVAQAEDDGIAYASLINGITRGGEKCNDYATCLTIIEAGGDPDYDGVSGPLEFSGNGEPLQASYGILEFGADNRLDNSKTVYKAAEAPSSADVPEVPVVGDRAGDGELKIGTILPQTGSLAFLGPPEFAGFDLAISDINAAGGVLGKPVVGSKGDSGDATTDTANQTVDRLLGENVDAIIGAASSGVSLTVIDKITGAGVVQFSPANTSKKLSTYEDEGLYFRTAPSDILQGAVIGELVAGDGATTVGIIARNDAYGTGLLEDVKSALADAGVEVVVEKVYDEKATTFDAEVEALAAADPDAIIVISFEEGSKILTAMVEQGIGPTAKAVYGCDGNIGNALGESFESGA
jgi:ABC-type branched-subunit amino acid transport system substrate-binding protein